MGVSRVYHDFVDIVAPSRGSVLFVFLREERKGRENEGGKRKDDEEQ